MSIKMFDFSELWTGATQLIDESTRSIFEYDAYAGKTKFPAVVLSPPVPYSSDQAGALIGVPKPEQESSDNQFLGDTVNRPGVFGFRARIIGPNSPHGFLPDPCATSISKKLPPDSKFKLVSMHTLFLSPQDYTIPSGEVLPSVGEVVLVELDNAQFGYNLEVGRFVSTISKPSMYFNEQTLTEQSCIDDKSGLDFTSTVGGTLPGGCGGRSYYGGANKSSHTIQEVQAALLAERNKNAGSMPDPPIASEALLGFIGSGEGGYNSMNQGTKGNKIVGSTPNASIHLGKNLTVMTMKEVLKFQSEGKLFAAGRYQIIPDTMKSSMRRAGVTESDIFNAATQDKLGSSLIYGNKRKNLRNYLVGTSTDIDAANLDFAKEWASVPSPGPCKGDPDPPAMT